MDNAINIELEQYLGNDGELKNIAEDIYRDIVKSGHYENYHLGVVHEVLRTVIREKFKEKLDSIAESILNSSINSDNKEFRKMVAEETAKIIAKKILD